jgi:regulator of replication initiation timing
LKVACWLWLYTQTIMPQSQISLTHNDTMTLFEKHDTSHLEKMSVGEINAYLKMRRKKEQYDKATQLTVMKEFRKKVIEVLQFDDDISNDEIFDFLSQMEKEYDPAMMDELKQENQELKETIAKDSGCEENAKLKAENKWLREGWRKESAECKMLRDKIYDLQGDNAPESESSEEEEHPLPMSNAGGYTHITKHGTEYTIARWGAVYKGHICEVETLLAIDKDGEWTNKVGEWIKFHEDQKFDSTLPFEIVEHLGHKGYILWHPNHPIKTCEINPSMNGLSS